MGEPRSRPNDLAARLVASTGRRLFLSTLALVALLVVAMGVATAVAGLGALDTDVDHALTATVDAELARLDGEIPTPDVQTEADEPPAGSSDTFVLDLGPDGAVAANPSRLAMAGLPVKTALVGARVTGRDFRTTELGGIAVRLLTVPVGDAATPVGYVQAGFILTLHDRESRSLALTILLVGLVGLAGAAIVTLLVTRRALAPIRGAFEAQMRFVADASHELRTPAAIIRGSAEVLEREGHVAPSGRTLISDIVSESDRLGGLVGDLLTLATTGSGSLTLKRGPVDLAGVAETAARRADALASGRGVTVVIVPPSAGGAIVDGDTDRLVQLVLILLDNAIDHAPSGSAVEVAVARVGQSIRLVVSDAGPGIPTGDRERIFEPFARLDRGVRRGSGNAGLGLAIARRIAVAHGGSIAAAERPGGGARFEVTLPVSRGRRD